MEIGGQRGVHTRGVRHMGSGIGGGGVETVVCFSDEWVWGGGVYVFGGGKWKLGQRGEGRKGAKGLEDRC